MPPRKLYIANLLAICCLFITTSLCSQDFSNKGKEFWVGYGSHVSMYNNSDGSVLASGGSQDMVLYFTSDHDAEVTVEIASLNYIRKYQVKANTVTTSDPMPKNTSGDSRITEEGKSQKGIHITSDFSIIAYAHIYNGSISGATLLFPVNTLAREYYSINYTQLSNSPYSYCYTYVIATEDDTNVEIILSANSFDHNAGDTIKVSLNKGEIYNVFGRVLSSSDNASSGEDLTGTKIRSVATSTSTCKKIAVFSGSGKIYISCNNVKTADNYIQQAFPANAWGKKYLTVPTAGMPNNYFRVVVSKPETVVKVDGSILSPSTLRNNFYYEFQSTTSTLIESDLPIMVAQYITTSGSCGNTSTGTNGDPEMIYLSPVEQTIKKITINSTPNDNIVSTLHFLNISIHKLGLASLKIDGAKPNFIPKPHPYDTNYVYLQENLAPGSHTIISDSGFNAIAYGYGNRESYGYNAGTNVIDQFQRLSVDNTYGTVKLPATCKGTPFKVSITLPYIPLSLKWIVPRNADIPIDYNPIYDSTFTTNGKTIYRYSLDKYLIFDTTGTFNVQVNVNNPAADGCSGEQQIDFELEVYGPPKALNEIISSNCITDNIILNDKTPVAVDDRAIIAYNWNIGNGILQNAKTFSYIPDRIGKHTISYFVITDIGCISDTIVKDIFIDSLPSVDFTFSSKTCFKQDILFTPITKAHGTAVLSKWIWNFGDASIIDTAKTNAAVTHQFDSLKSYTVSLGVITENGCLNAVNKTIVNNPIPEVGFVLPEVCLEDVFALFTDTTKIADNSTGFQYKWDFGDAANTSFPNTDIVANPKHRYLLPGNYTVKLQVTSNAGCVGNAVSDFTVNGSIPQARFEVVNDTALCSNREVVVVNNSRVDIGTVGKLIIFWDANGNLNDTTVDENPTQGKQYKHVYANFSYPNNMNFNIRMFAYTGNTCADDSLVTISIVPPPSAASAITYKNYVCLSDTLAFNPAIIGGIAPFQSTWFSSNSNAAIFDNNILKGIQAANVDISLKLVDAKKCEYQFNTIKNIPVRSIPIAILRAKDTVICNGDPVTLLGQGGTTYKWLLNDLLVHTNVMDTFATAAEGMYKLIVNDGFCNSLKSASMNIIGLSIPIYTFTHNEYTCTKGNLAIETDAIEKNNVHFLWNFGDGAIFNKAQPLSHSYDSSGNYVIKLAVTNDYCPKYEYELIGDTIKVLAPLPPSIFTLFLLAGQDTLLSVKKVDSGYVNYNWDPKLYLSNPFIANPIFNSEKSIQYTLTRTDPVTACFINDIYKMEVSKDIVVSMPKAFTPNGDNLNDKLKIEFGAGLKSFNILKIFNRFGRLVFQTANINEGWDGKFNGIDQEMDAYTYLIDYITFKDEHIIKTGSAILLR